MIKKIIFLLMIFLVIISLIGCTVYNVTPTRKHRKYKKHRKYRKNKVVVNNKIVHKHKKLHHY
ncbi:MAG: hypothetical protein GY817_05360 [bacterium]|nr:hypothetical protein [bacterium]